MKISLFILGLCMMSAFQSCCKKPIVVSGFPQQDVAVPLDSIMNELKAQYDYAINELGNSNKIKVVAADVIFDVTNTSLVDGNIKVLVIRADIKKATLRESTVIFSLADTTKSKNYYAARQRNTPNYELGKLIISSANAFKSIKNIYIGPTGARQFEVDVVFGVTLSGALDVNPSINIVSINASYERDHLVQQTIKMVFQVDQTN
ncbi:MAG TPA: hypothetical protein VFI33_02895 [Puia sp.]|nr:hypothetical protein [Puia sp.]